MKRAILILLLALANLSSFGQEIRFTDSTNTWKVFSYSCVGDHGASYYVHSYLSDTIYRGTTYKRLPPAFIREDVMAKKIFTIYPTDTVEQLLYDFNLNIGDTFKCAVATHYVSSIDSVLINSYWHKTLLMVPVNCPGCPSSYTAFPYYVIEGIGSICAPYTPLSPMHFYESCIALTCFNNHGTIPPLSRTVGPYFNNISSCSLTFGLNVNNLSKAKKTSVIPNPIDNTTKIVFTDNLSGSLMVLNSIGQVIVNASFTNENELLIGDKITVSGLYYYRVTDEQNGKVYSGKFVRQ